MGSQQQSNRGRQLSPGSEARDFDWSAMEVPSVRAAWPASARRLDDRGREAATLTRVVNGMLPNGSLGALRPIFEGDETLLQASELIGLERSVIGVRRASGAGREVARTLCQQLGVHVTDIPRLPNRVPVWPPGVVGSIAHDPTFAAAVVAHADQFNGVGIDIEPTEPLPAGVARLVGSRNELRAVNLRWTDTTLFSIKEAVFKAVFPTDGIFLEFSDVMVDTSSHTAATRYGRTVYWRAHVSSRIVAVAWICGEPIPNALPRLSLEGASE